jgi:hypothetical protein
MTDDRNEKFNRLFYNNCNYEEDSKEIILIYKALLGPSFLLNNTAYSIILQPIVLLLEQSSIRKQVRSNNLCFRTFACLFVGCV